MSKKTVPFNPFFAHFTTLLLPLARVDFSKFKIFLKFGYW